MAQRGWAGKNQTLDLGTATVMHPRKQPQSGDRLAGVLAATLLAAVVLLAMPVQPVAAQIEMRSFYQGYRPTVSREDADALKETLDLDESQEALMRAIHSGYSQAYNNASDAIRDELRSLQEGMGKSDNPGVKESFYGEYNRVREEWADESRQMELGFFADVKALLSEDQALRWPRFERDRRRRVGLLLAARLMPERVDLVDVLDSLDLPDEAREACEGVVEQYAEEFDRPLALRHALSDQMERLSYSGDGKGGGDDSQMRSLDERLKRLHVELRDVNLRFVEVFVSRLSPEDGGRFVQEFRRRVWPRYFSVNEVAQDAEHVRSIAALAPGQEEALAALLAAHEVRMEPIHRELVQLEMTRELHRLWPTGRPESGQALPGGGGPEAVENQTGRLLETRKAQIRATLADIRALLTSEQLRALSRGANQDEEGQERQ